MACVSYVNGRWRDGDLRASAARTAAEALVAGAIEAAIVAVLGLIAATLTARGRRRGVPRRGPFCVVGFADAA